MVEKRNLLIAIVGPTNGGKTDLTRGVSRTLEAAGITVATYSYDEHDLYPSNSPNLDLLMARGGPKHWEDPLLFDNNAFLENLKRWRGGLPAILPANSRESMEEGLATRLVPPGEVNIVEGVGVLYFPQVRELLDTSFYIDLPEDIMVARRLARRDRNSSEPWDSENYINGAMILGTREYVTPQREHATHRLEGIQPREVLVRQVIENLPGLKLK